MRRSGHHTGVYAYSAQYTDSRPSSSYDDHVFDDTRIRYTSVIEEEEEEEAESSEVSEGPEMCAAMRRKDSAHSQCPQDRQSYRYDRPGLDFSKDSESEHEMGAFVKDQRPSLFAEQQQDAEESWRRVQTKKLREEKRLRNGNTVNPSLYGYHDISSGIPSSSQPVCSVPFTNHRSSQVYQAKRPRLEDSQEHNLGSFNPLPRRAKSATRRRSQTRAGETSGLVDTHMFRKRTFDSFIDDDDYDEHGVERQEQDILATRRFAESSAAIAESRTPAKRVKSTNCQYHTAELYSGTVSFGAMRSQAPREQSRRNDHSLEMSQGRDPIVKKGTETERRPKLPPSSKSKVASRPPPSSQMAQSGLSLTKGQANSSTAPASAQTSRQGPPKASAKAVPSGQKFQQKVTTVPKASRASQAVQTRQATVPGQTADSAKTPKTNTVRNLTTPNMARMVYHAKLRQQQSLKAKAAAATAASKETQITTQNSAAVQAESPALFLTVVEPSDKLSKPITTFAKDSQKIDSLQKLSEQESSRMVTESRATLVPSSSVEHRNDNTPPKTTTSTTRTGTDKEALNPQAKVDNIVIPLYKTGTAKSSADKALAVLKSVPVNRRPTVSQGPAQSTAYGTAQDSTKDPVAFPATSIASPATTPTAAKTFTPIKESPAMPASSSTVTMPSLLGTVKSIVPTPIRKTPALPAPSTTMSDGPVSRLHMESSLGLVNPISCSNRRMTPAPLASLSTVSDRPAPGLSVASLLASITPISQPGPSVGPSIPTSVLSPAEVARKLLSMSLPAKEAASTIMTTTTSAMVPQNFPYAPTAMMSLSTPHLNMLLPRTPLKANLPSLRATGPRSQPVAEPNKSAEKSLLVSESRLSSGSRRFEQNLQSESRPGDHAQEQVQSAQAPAAALSSLQDFFQEVEREKQEKLRCDKEVAGQAQRDKAKAEQERREEAARHEAAVRKADEEMRESEGRQRDASQVIPLRGVPTPCKARTASATQTVPRHHEIRKEPTPVNEPPLGSQKTIDSSATIGFCGKSINEIAATVQNMSKESTDRRRELETLEERRRNERNKMRRDRVASDAAQSKRSENKVAGQHDPRIVSTVGRAAVTPKPTEMLFGYSKNPISTQSRVPDWTSPVVAPKSVPKQQPPQGSRQTEAKRPGKPKGPIGRSDRPVGKPEKPILSSEEVQRRKQEREARISSNIQKSVATKTKPIEEMSLLERLKQNAMTSPVDVSLSSQTLSALARPEKPAISPAPGAGSHIHITSSQTAVPSGSLPPPQRPEKAVDISTIPAIIPTNDQAMMPPVQTLESHSTANLESLSSEQRELIKWREQGLTLQVCADRWEKMTGVKKSRSTISDMYKKLTGTYKPRKKERERSANKKSLMPSPVSKLRISNSPNVQHSHTPTRTTSISSDADSLLDAVESAYEEVMGAESEQTSGKVSSGREVDSEGDDSSGSDGDSSEDDKDDDEDDWILETPPKGAVSSDDDTSSGARATTGGKCLKQAAIHMLLARVEAFNNEIDVEPAVTSEESSDDEGAPEVRIREPSPITERDQCHYVYQVKRKTWEHSRTEEDAEWYAVGEKVYYEDVREANAAASNESLVERFSPAAIVGRSATSFYTEVDKETSMMTNIWKTPWGITKVVVDRYLRTVHNGKKPRTKAHWLPRHLYEIKIKTMTKSYEYEDDDLENTVEVESESMENDTRIFTILDLANREAAKRVIDLTNPHTMRIDDIEKREEAKKNWERRVDQLMADDGRFDEEFSPSKDVQCRVWVGVRELVGPRN